MVCGFQTPLQRRWLSVGPYRRSLWAGALPYLATSWKLSPSPPLLAVLKPQLSLNGPMKTYLIGWGAACAPSMPPFLTHYLSFRASCSAICSPFYRCLGVGLPS